ncbi:hypothetical protein PGAL8A_00194900 [Plasmodium gallinaceum]|uniref:Uncharacterized protein n=1 Tax=Plasmodium gallinaceum TaxID=5849 RepID=A0A1J1GQI7_PLAGA|nr:hypothetical protein PGAL8A_00194900 [Plasmodium gallinaceum]CRG94554.1 hypothetical protein PGAL8A_00194900 [Plasmodium gallinaceum]
MKFSTALYFFYYFLVINWLTPCISIRSEPPLYFPLGVDELKHLLRHSLMTGVTNSAKIINFKFNVMEASVEKFKNSTQEERNEMLNSKDQLLNAITKLAELKDLKIEEVVLKYIANFVMDELIRINEGNLNEAQGYQECREYSGNYDIYIDQKCKMILKEMKYIWNSNIFIKDIDPLWKDEKWDLWYKNYTHFVTALKKNNYMIFLSMLQKNIQKKSCKGIYEFLEKDFMRSYYGPLMAEFDKFFKETLGEWRKKSQ